METAAVRAYQAIAHPLAKAKINVDLAAMMTTKAGWLFDNGLPAGEASNVAKYAAAEAAVEAVDHVIQLHGGNGLSAEYGLLPQWGLARLLRIAPVSREMILELRRAARPLASALVLVHDELRLEVPVLVLGDHGLADHVARARPGEEVVVLRSYLVRGL